MHIAIVGSYVDSVVNFRGDLVRELVSRGCRVTALVPEATSEQSSAIRNLGAEIEQYDLVRNGISVSSDLKTLFQLRRKFKQISPDVVLAYTIKPVIYSGLALQTVSRTRFFPMITGLGYVFHGTGWKRKCLRRLVRVLYGRAMANAQCVFFQNTDNRDCFANLGILRGVLTVTLPGSGVNLDHFTYQPIPSKPIVFLMIARLLGEKGVREYVAAATQLRREYPNASFRLVGLLDPSPDGILQDELDSWIASGSVEFLGELRDVRPALASCHIYVLPSYHEGMPRSVLEAMAIGRAVITTNTPGCRETVLDGATGFLVESKNVASLVERMKYFLENTEQIESMGAGGRRYAEEKFDVRRVNELVIEQLMRP